MFSRLELNYDEYIFEEEVEGSDGRYDVAVLHVKENDLSIE